MLIKIVQNGIESDWFQLTKKAHRELIKIKPEAAIIHIEDVYPESPDAGRVIRLDFSNRRSEMSAMWKSSGWRPDLRMLLSWHQRRWMNSI